MNECIAVKAMDIGTWKTLHSWDRKKAQDDEADATPAPAGAGGAPPPGPGAGPANKPATPPADKPAAAPGDKPAGAPADKPAAAPAAKAGAQPATQDGAAPNAAAGEDPAATEEGGAEEKEEECEEAWEYVEYMKKELKEKIESILQDTLFQPRPLLEETVTMTMEQVLEIRDAILDRTKAIRNKDGTINICREQNINQEEFLTQIRMQVMSVLLGLIEKDAATPEKLQDVGKQLLAIRTKVNGEITRMIMLRESSASTRTAPKEDCDCGILGELVEGLENVLNKEKNQEEEGAQDAAGDQEGADDAKAKEGQDEGGEDTVQQLTMLLMTVDAEIRSLYNEILGELDDTAREALSNELQDLKSISTQLHEALSQLSELDPAEDQDAIDKIIRRDVRAIRNDAKKLLDDCQQRCPGECDSCGAERIDQVAEKLADYKANLEDLAEEEAKDGIRSDLMQYLTQTNSDMTDLLREKAQNGELDECGSETLEVIDKIKGPLWMMVNITIFGDANTMSEMVNALEQALTEMRSQYCGPDNSTAPEPKSDDTDECDFEEINKAKEWITDIDEIIAQDIFKNEADEGRRNAMLGLIDLKSTMDDRVRELFQDNLQCKEEVEQIKNIYAQKITECLAEMMNPRFRFDLLGRAERVQCVKDLRILIEDRRGVLLMREIEARINRVGTGINSVGDEPEEEEAGEAAEAQETPTEGA
eukprot:maker-scaffold687_size111633-snap-gene-0.26 protein:Tk07137 transcript:maker-scaffold687_size111633-snap-gene-0.26-mRNA-1 annotation:"pollen specific glycine-rich protein grp16"